MKKRKLTTVEVIDILLQVEERSKENYQETKRLVSSLIANLEKDNWSEFIKAKRFKNN